MDKQAVVEVRITDRSTRQTLREFSKRLYRLAGAGAVAFWIADFLISVSPIWSGCRSVFSVSSLPAALAEALAGGLIVGFGVGYSLVLFLDRVLPTRPVLKTVVLGFAVAAIIEVLCFLSNPDNARTYLLIDTGMNLSRVLAFGLAIGIYAGPIVWLHRLSLSLRAKGA